MAAKAPPQSSATAAERIYSRLHGRLTRGEFEPGEQLPSLRQMAADFDASKATLQAVLQQLKHEGLVTAEHGRGFFVAGRRTPMQKLLLVAPTTGHLWADYTSAFIAAVGQRPDLSLVVEPAEFGEDETVRQKVQAHIDEGVGCVIFNGFGGRGGRGMPALRDQVNVVAFFSGEELPDDDRRGLVTSDWQRGPQLAIEHLADVGCRHVLMLTHSDNTGDTRVMNEAALEAARAAGMELEVFAHRPSEPSYNAQVKELLDATPGIDGLFATADYRAAPLLPSLRAWGYPVPERLKVVGYFNTPWSQACDPLMTSVCTQPHEMVAQVLRMVDEQRFDAVWQVEPKLIVRGSTGG